MRSNDDSNRKYNNVIIKMLSIIRSDGEGGYSCNGLANDNHNRLKSLRKASRLQPWRPGAMRGNESIVNVTLSQLLFSRDYRSCQLGRSFPGRLYIAHFEVDSGEVCITQVFFLAPSALSYVSLGRALMKVSGCLLAEGGAMMRN